MKYILSSINADKITDENQISEVVLFPIGENKIENPMSGTDGAVLKVDELFFNKIKASVKDVSKYFVDYVHEGKEAAGWLKDVIWDNTQGIIAKVQFTKEAVAKIKDNVYKFVSPAFLAGKDINDFVEFFPNCFALVNDPAMPSVKEYPIKLSKKVETKELLFKMGIDKIELTPEGGKADLLFTNSVGNTISVEKIYFNKDYNIINQDSEVINNATKKNLPLPVQLCSDGEMKKDVVDEEDMEKEEMVKLQVEPDPAVEALKNLEKSLTDFISRMNDRMEAMETSLSNVILSHKKVEDTLIEVNTEQCKIQDTIKGINQENKKVLLTKVYNKDNQPEVLPVKKETKAGVDKVLLTKVFQLMKEKNLSYNTAWAEVNKQ